MLVPIDQFKTMITTLACFKLLSVVNYLLCCTLVVIENESMPSVFFSPQILTCTYTLQHSLVLLFLVASAER